MVTYIIRRFLYMLLLLALASVAAFAIIQLPPGDYLTTYVERLKAQGQDIGEAEIASLRKAYGLDRPVHIQYLLWLEKILLRGDMGRSFSFRRPVTDLIKERLGATLLLSFGATGFVYIVAIPIGIYSATHQYSLFDYLATVIGFLGVATPSFILALILMVVFFNWFGVSVGGLFSPGMEREPWSWNKAVDMLKHLPVPLVVIGLSGTASLIRVMRATLLDELGKPYVQSARAKGLKESRLLLKYPVRIAVNPIASTVGWLLPSVFSGSTIVSIVLGLPTVGPLLYTALTSQDMFLAAGIVMISTALTVFGTFLSDLVLAWLDPRIRLGTSG